MNGFNDPPAGLSCQDPTTFDTPYPLDRFARSTHQQVFPGKCDIEVPPENETL